MTADEEAKIVSAFREMTKGYVRMELQLHALSRLLIGANVLSPEAIQIAYKEIGEEIRSISETCDKAALSDVLEAFSSSEVEANPASHTVKTPKA